MSGGSAQICLFWTDKLGLKRLVHTIGNLRLTADNSKLSNNLFSRKKELFEQSHLEMNREIADAPTWDETAILERADRLADRAIALWPAPLRTDD